jgi:hypothetical protein
VFASRPRIDPLKNIALCDCPAASAATALQKHIYCLATARYRFPNLATASGGRGRIRTFVARKERQIYSLLVLATHPPVPEKSSGMPSRIPQTRNADRAFLKFCLR